MGLREREGNATERKAGPIYKYKSLVHVILRFGEQEA